MSSSESGGRAKLKVTTSLPLTDIRVFNSNLETSARGTGSLEAELEPGIYRMQVSFGSEVRQTLIALRPGEVHEETASPIEFLSAAPVAGTTWAAEEQQQAVASATHAERVQPGQGQIVFFLRNVHRDAPPLTAELIASIELKDSRLQRVPTEVGTRKSAGDSSWISLSLALAPGGYAMEIRRPHGRLKRFDQSLWVSSGWTTIVFIPTRKPWRGSEDSGSDWIAAPEVASIHMIRVGQDWQNVADGRTPETLALESALAALRQGRRLRAPELEQKLLDSKFENPMLGIIGAHGLFLAHMPDVPEIETVIGNLGRIVPGHPDVVALHWMLHSLKDSPNEPLPPAIDWPPMVAAGYRATLDAGGAQSGAVVEGSVADRAADSLVSAGIWTAWKPLPQTQLEPEHFDEVALNSDAQAVVSMIGSTLEKGGTRSGEVFGSPSLRAALQDLHQNDQAGTEALLHALSATKSVDPSVERLRLFVCEMLELAKDTSFHDFVDQLDAATLAQSTGVPLRRVREMLAVVRSPTS